jgi:hypothetical protein
MFLFDRPSTMKHEMVRRCSIDAPLMFSLTYVEARVRVWLLMDHIRFQNFRATGALDKGGILSLKVQREARPLVS